MAEKIIQNPSITSGSFTIDDGKIVAIAGMPLAGSGGGTQSDFVYVPSFNDETGDISFILGITGTEGKGPWHISGTPGPKGEDGAQGEPGNDACPITATSAEVDDGVHVTISYTSGGNALTEFDILDGYDGYSPQVTTASVNNDATHNNGGTEINITYKDDDSILTAKYTAWNGNNGEGATIALNGKDGIAISNNGSNYYAGLSADYLVAVQSVSSKLTKTSADTLYQPIGTYALKSEIPTKVTDLTDSANYVVTGDILTGTGNKLTGIKIGSTSYTVPTTDLSNYYTKTQVDSTFASASQLNSYLTTAQYQTDSAAYAKKTDLEGFVTSSDITTQDTDYVMTITGWKVLTLPGGGMTQVIHDETLTGQGNANDNKLGVAWSALSGNTINSALSAGSAASAYFATKAKYGDQREYEIGSEIYGLTYFRTSIINWTNLINGNSGIDALDLDEDGYPETFQLTQTAYNAVTSVSSKVDKPNSLANKYLVLRTDGNSDVSGWSDLQEQCYSKTEATGTFVHRSMLDNGTGGTLTGTGLTGGSILGVNTNVIQTKLTDAQLSAISSVSGKVDIPTAASADNKYLVYSTKTTDSGWCELSVGSDYLPLSGGTVSGDVIVKSTGTNLLAVNTTATLMGQSRVVNLTDTTAIGTNWLGVNGNGGGFLKNVQGGNVGALNGTSIQIDFAPNGNTAYGNITVNSQGNESKVVHVPTASYNSMSSFDNTNGPNYMLRKTASGFDIGAAVINVTALPATTEANAYYFVYDV